MSQEGMPSVDPELISAIDRAFNGVSLIEVSRGILSKKIKELRGRLKPLLSDIGPRYYKTYADGSEWQVLVFQDEDKNGAPAASVVINRYSSNPNDINSEIINCHDLHIPLEDNNPDDNLSIDHWTESVVAPNGASIPFPNYSQLIIN